MLQQSKSAAHTEEVGQSSETTWRKAPAKAKNPPVANSSLEIAEVRRAIDGTVRKAVIPSLLTRATVQGGSNVHPTTFGATAYGAMADQIDPLDITRFTDALLDGDLAHADALFQQQLDSGLTWKELAMNLACPAAADMGERWGNDTASFAAVSLGMSLIHRILNQEFHRSFGHLEPRSDRGTVAVASLAGDQHLLGSTLLERYFQIAQWRVYSLLGSKPQELGNMLAGRGIDVLCLSLNGRFDAVTLAGQIKNWRRWSTNKQLSVIVGGHCLASDPSLVERLGADASASDFDGAVDLAFSLMERNKG